MIESQRDFSGLKQLHTCMEPGIPAPPRNIDDALRALRGAAHRLRLRSDSRAIFPDVYGIITEKVAEELRQPGGLFLEPAFISRLAGCFAERYLWTLRSSLGQRAQDCQAWTLAYSYKDHPRFAPIQHAALGISAHINFDLALGIHRTIVELGAANDSRLIQRFKHDHDAVNAILQDSVAPAIKRLADVYRCRSSALVSRFTLEWSTRVATTTLASWRERVWDNVLALLASPDELSRRRVIRRMDRQSGLLGRLLAAGGALSRLTGLPGTGYLLPKALAS